MRVLEEPTAAAIAYGLHQKPDVHHILVYDFGGGTLDVSLLYVHEGFVTVEGVDGDDHLGGRSSRNFTGEYRALTGGLIARGFQRIVEEGGRFRRACERDLKIVGRTLLRYPCSNRLAAFHVKRNGA